MAEQEASRIDIALYGRNTREVSFILFKVGPVILAICILAMFLIPAPYGPFSAVHGPATAFRSVRAASQILSAPAGCLKSATGFLMVALAGFIVLFDSGFRFTLGEDARPVSSVLRC